MEASVVIWEKGMIFNAPDGVHLDYFCSTYKQSVACLKNFFMLHQWAEG